MVQSPSWEANRFAVSQEIPHISKNPKVHYRTHKRPPPVSNLGQPNPVHIPTSHLLEIHPNIIHPSTPRSPQWSPSPVFLTKTLYTPSIKNYQIKIFMWLLLIKFSLHDFYNIICMNSVFTWAYTHLDIPVLMLPVFCTYCALLVETKTI